MYEYYLCNQPSQKGIAFKQTYSCTLGILPVFQLPFYLTSPCVVIVCYNALSLQIVQFGINQSFFMFMNLIKTSTRASVYHIGISKVSNRRRVIANSPIPCSCFFLERSAKCACVFCYFWWQSSVQRCIEQFVNNLVNTIVIQELPLLLEDVPKYDYAQDIYS